MPIRPTSMVKMMTSFPEMLSNGLKFKLNPTVLSADTTSKIKVKTGTSFSVMDNIQTAAPSQQK
jgi:hypothetical protein